MAETPYLVDSNVLLRWVKPDHSDYPAIASATDAILRSNGVLCYTSQNVAEFWNAWHVPALWLAMATAFRLKTRTVVQDFSRKSSVCFRTASRFTKSGAHSW